MSKATGYLPVGKVPLEVLSHLLRHYSCRDPRVVVGPGIGEDAAVIEFGDKLLVAKADPITFATDQIGWYAVNVNANDIAAMGATPRWFLPTLLFPEDGTDEGMVEEIFAQIHQACSALGIEVIGGHSEITFGLDRLIVAGQMLGETSPEELVTTSGAQVGDDVLVTKGIAIEGTSIIAREKSDDLRHRGVPPQLIDKAKRFLSDPGISVVRDAQIAVGAGEVHCMHDPTEGGIATGLREIAEAAQVGLEIEADSIPVFPETRQLCELFDLSPYGLIASGCLLLTCSPHSTACIIAALQTAGIESARIGRVHERDFGLRWKAGGVAQPFPQFPVDEIARLFD